MHTELYGIILAGGRGQRMGGIDKGWVRYNGRPLIEQVVARLSPQVDRLVISANRNLQAYRRFGHPVVSDLLQGYPGPLAGILSAGLQASGEWLLVVPCDLPYLPLDLSARLLAAVQQRPARIALVHDGMRSQHLCLLLQRSLLDDLGQYLDSGERRVISWIERHAWTQVDFSDQPESFSNLNRPQAD